MTVPVDDPANKAGANTPARLCCPGGGAAWIGFDGKETPADTETASGRFGKLIR